MSHPIIGVGIIIQNADGKVLVGKRTKSHAPYRSIPGGKLDEGETFEQGAIRETKEETNLDLHTIKVINLTNNLETYAQESLHTISIVLYSNDFSGTLKNMEPHKCAGRERVDPRHLPTPHFEASKKGIENRLTKRFYMK